jgi:hypothetical protein
MTQRNLKATETKLSNHCSALSALDDFLNEFPAHRVFILHLRQTCCRYVSRARESYIEYTNRSLDMTNKQYGLKSIVLSVIFLLAFSPVVFGTHANSTVASAVATGATSTSSCTKGNNPLIGSGDKVDIPMQFNVPNLTNMANIDIPYTQVNIEPLPNTLVTYALPATVSSFRYVSIALLKGMPAAYVFNTQSSLQQYSLGKVISTYSNSTIQNVGNGYTLTSTFNATVWLTKIPGGYSDPSVGGVATSQWNDFFGLAFKAWADGTFNYQGTTINGINPTYNNQLSGSHTGFGYSLCGQSTIVSQVPSTTGWVQQYANAAAFDCPFTDWISAWPAVVLNLYQSTQVVPYNNQGDSGQSIACQCYGVSFPSPPTP